jgi:hypothetical protein
MSMMDSQDPLAALRPLHAPEPIPWWPPAPGWWLLAGLVVAGILGVLWWRRRMAPRSAAMAELASLAARTRDPVEQAAGVNQLLKRYALVCWPRPGVASLTGEAWLEFLDEHGGAGDFSQGPGRALLQLPYGGTGPGADQLITLARRWIRANRPRRWR